MCVCACVGAGNYRPNVHLKFPNEVIWVCDFQPGTRKGAHAFLADTALFNSVCQFPWCKYLTP